MIKCGCYSMVLAEEEGWKLWTPTSYLEASKEFIDEVTGGCGPGSWGDSFIPDRLLGESVYLSCRRHDWMYREGTTAEDKWWSDWFFLGNMVIQINDNEYLDNPRLEMAMKYYRAVSFLGNNAFNSSNE